MWINFITGVFLVKNIKVVPKPEYNYKDKSYMNIIWMLLVLFENCNKNMLPNL